MIWGRQEDRCGSVENSSISGYILKIEPTGFNVGLEQISSQGRL